MGDSILMSYRIHIPDIEITEDDYLSFQNNILSLTQIIDKYDAPCYTIDSKTYKNPYDVITETICGG